MDSYNSPRFRGSVIVGTMLLALGMLFLLNNLDFIYIGPVAQYWPLIVVAIGVTKFLAADHPADRRHGGWWVLIGLWMLISTTHTYGLSFHNSWPILLIIMGLNSLWKALVPDSNCRHSKGYHYAN